MNWTTVLFALLLISFMLFGPPTAAATAEADAWTLLWQGDLLEAESEFSTQLKADPDNPDLLRGRGLARYATGMSDQAFDDFAQALETMDRTNPYWVPLRDFVVTELLSSTSQANRLLAVNTMVAEDPATPLWVRREALLNIEGLQQRWKNNLDAAIRTIDELGALRSWVLLGPFDNTAESGFHREYIDELEVARRGPTLVDTFAGKNNLTLKWFRPPLEHLEGDVKLHNYLDLPVNAVAYAHTGFDVWAEGEHGFFLSRRGAIKIWVDDELVYESDEYIAGNETDFFSLSLGIGSHTILVKNASLIGGLEFLIGMHPLDDTDRALLASYARGTAFDTYFPSVPVGKEDPLLLSLADKVDGHPDDPEALFWFGWMMRVKGFQQQVLELVAEDAGAATTPWLNVIKYSLYDNNMEEGKAIQTARRVAAEMPDFYPLQFVVLSQWLDEDRTDDVAERLAALLAAQPSWYNGKMLQIFLDFSLADMEQGFLRLQELVNEYPEVPELYQLLAIRAAMYGLEEQEPILMQRAGELGFHEDARNYLLRRSLNMRDYETARSVAERKTQFQPTDEGNWLVYVQTRRVLESGQISELIELVDDLRKSYPYSEDMLNQKQLLLEQRIHENELAMREDQGAVYQLSALVADDKRTLRDVYQQRLELNPLQFGIREQIRRLDDDPPLSSFYDPLRPLPLIKEYRAERTTSLDDIEYVLDDVVYHHFDDGAVRVIYHKLIALHTQQGVEDYGVQWLEHNPRNSNVELLLAAAHKPDGSQVEGERVGQKVSFAGLEPGDIIEIRYNVDFYSMGTLSREFWTSYQFNSGIPAWYNRLMVIHPRSLDLNVRLSNADTVPIEETMDTVDGNFTRRVWKGRRLPAIPDEPMQPSMDQRAAQISITTLDSWEPIRDWYHSKWPAQCEVTKDIQTLVDSLIVESASRDETIARLHDFVARQVATEDLDFMYSAHVPQKAQVVLEDRFGDCKDKAVLLITMLKASGIPAHIALVNSSDRSDLPPLPSMKFNHAFVVLPDEQGERIFDPTQYRLTAGEVSLSTRSDRYLAVPLELDGPAELRLPANTVDTTRFALRVVPDAEGNGATIHGHLVGTGDYGVILRELLSSGNQQRREQAMHGFLNNQLPGFRLDSVEVVSLESLVRAPEIRFQGWIPNLMRHYTGGRYTLQIPRVHWIDDDLTPVARAVEERHHPISLKNLWHNTPLVAETIVELPNGMVVEALPEDVNLWLGGSMQQSTYRQDGQQIRVRERLYIETRTLPATEIERVQAFVLTLINSTQDLILLGDASAETVPE